MCISGRFLNLTGEACCGSSIDKKELKPCHFIHSGYVPVFLDRIVPPFIVTYRLDTRQPLSTGMDVPARFLPDNGNVWGRPGGPGMIHLHLHKLQAEV